MMALSLLSAPVSAQEDPLVGTWYGHDRQPDGELLQRISRRASNGALSIEFRKYENCVVVSRFIEKGTWRRKSNIEIVEINSINGEPHAYLDHYEILEIDDQAARLKHVESGTVFSSERVSPDFEFPDCELFS